MEKRLYIVCFFFLLVVGFIWVKLFYWQVYSFDSLKSLAENQTNITQTLQAKRGRIYTQDKSVLALNQNAYLIYGQPQKIEDVKLTAEVISENTDLPLATISAKLSNTKLRWIQLADKVEEEKINIIQKEKLKGIGFIESSKRFYPEASMAAHLLGFVGKSTQGEDRGYFGLEGYYDEQLKGRDGILRQEKDASGNPIIAGNSEEISAKNGRDLYLTIDKTVQFIVETKLEAGVEKYGAKGGNVIVMDPYTGAVIAMASLPSYNPSKVSQYEEGLYKNPVIASSYEPGSTFKVLVMAAAINENKVSPDTKFNEEKSVKIGNYSINTWNHQYHGEIDMTGVIQYSSNVGMVFVERKLGHDNLFRYIRDLGIGSLTEIDLQDESTPSLRNENNWYEIDYATASFGQGIALTPIQMIRAVAAIANGGKLMKPYIVKEIHSENGKIITVKPQLVKHIYKKETASVVTEMMVAAIERGETKFLKPLGVRIAGKTGTAQIAISGHYDSDKTIASFVGFVPADKPKYIMLVTINEPTSSPWGSETAAPLFFSITKELISYYNISSTD